MLLVIGEGAHVRGTDVEKMVPVVRLVRDAGAKLCTLLDQGDASLAARRAKHVRGEQHAAGTAANDEDTRH